MLGETVGGQSKVATPGVSVRRIPRPGPRFVYGEAIGQSVDFDRWAVQGSNPRSVHSVADAAFGGGSDGRSQWVLEDSGGALTLARYSYSLAARVASYSVATGWGTTADHDLSSDKKHAAASLSLVCYAANPTGNADDIDFVVCDTAGNVSATYTLTGAGTLASNPSGAFCIDRAEAFAYLVVQPIGGPNPQDVVIVAVDLGDGSWSVSPVDVPTIVTATGHAWPTIAGVVEVGSGDLVVTSAARWLARFTSAASLTWETTHGTSAHYGVTATASLLWVSVDTPAPSTAARFVLSAGTFAGSIPIHAFIPAGYLWSDPVI